MIYDCVIFFNELDLLEIRMEELGELVDWFVVVESPVTFSGQPKPLHFEANRDRFAPWAGKIIHVVVDDMPAGPDPWRRERFQRNAVTRGLAGAGADDGIILSDADEIPRPEALRQWRPDMGARRFNQLFCYYWLNCVGGTWTGSRILPFGHLRRYEDLEAVRKLECPVLDDGGWHFSYLGGAERIAAKLAAFSHQDLNCDRYRDRQYLEQVTSVGIDLFGRANHRFQFWPLDERFPRAVRAQPARYASLVRSATFREDWYPDDQLLRVCELVGRTRGLAGAVIEIGCWEGRSTVALAQAAWPEPLLAVDTWAGNADETPEHDSVGKAAARDVRRQFQDNVEILTKGNVVPICRDCHAFLAEWSGPIKFAHIDASADYSSVRRMLTGLLPWVVDGGILCGDDFLSACASRADLGGGVERAVRDVLPNFTAIHNLWVWQNHR